MVSTRHLEFHENPRMYLKILCTRFRIFQPPESLWNRFKWILLDQEYVLEKKSSKNIIFFISKKTFEKKIWKIFEHFEISFRDSEIFENIFNQKNFDSKIFGWNFLKKSQNP